ncbi:MAG: Rrf2 family transcriptional regulator [Acidobacteria bacterium]|nr:Rrf2 family transcriptional regulator [Acidobacteriota bacterium]
MRLNTRGRYGLQLLTQLACHVKDPKPVGLKQVAAATGLPWRYLEQIAGPLRKAALIKGRPGRTGGYVLGRLPDRISLREVIESGVGPLCLMDCVDLPSMCDQSPGCSSRQVWVKVTRELRDVLDRFTLADLANRPCSGLRDAAKRARGARKTAAKPPARGGRSAKKWRFVRSYE